MPCTVAVGRSPPNFMELTANPCLRRLLVKTRMLAHHSITLSQARPALTRQHLRLPRRIQLRMMIAVESTVPAESVQQMNRIRLRSLRLILLPWLHSHERWPMSTAILTQQRLLKSSQILVRRRIVMRTTVLSSRQGVLRLLLLRRTRTLPKLPVRLRHPTRQRLQALPELLLMLTRQKLDCNRRRPVFRSALMAEPPRRLRRLPLVRDLPPRLHPPQMATSRALADR